MSQTLNEEQRQLIRHEVARRRIEREDVIAAEEKLVDAAYARTWADLPTDPPDNEPQAARIGRVIHLAATAQQELGDLDLLSRREREVLFLVASGYANQEIGAALYISEETVKTHVSHILRNLSARNRAHAVAIAAAVISPDVVQVQRLAA